MEVANMTQKQNSPVSSEPVRRIIFRVIVITSLLAMIGGALSIAFFYESQTLWYKVGSDKIMLRGGQLFGLLTATLLFTQIVLAVRGKLLLKAFKLASIMRWHRFNGVLVAFCAVCHVLLVLVPEGLTNLPFGWEFWPEMVGMLLLSIILFMVISSQFRQQIGFNYQRWRGIHRFLGYLAVVVVGIHTFFVSDSFAHPVPAVALFLSLVGVALVVGLSKKGAGKN